jgi:hypothetical protein
MKMSNVQMIVDCGVDDFLIEPNRELHRRLLFNQTPHDYSEPGKPQLEPLSKFIALPRFVLFTMF